METLTALSALRAEIHSPVGNDFLRIRLLARHLNPEDVCTCSLPGSRAFQGAIADSLISLLEMPNGSEGDLAWQLNNRELIILRANAIYRRIGEPEVKDEKPTPKVYIGL